MTRDERQNECVKNWVKSRCVAGIIASTGFGKTRIAIKAITLLVKKKFPDLTVLIVVPTSNLKEQWENNLKQFNLEKHCKVEVINTVIKTNWEVDMLVCDEIHLYASRTFSAIFTCVKYKFILGLTATFERLDGKHKTIEKYCPICDNVTLAEVIKNHWIADYTEYLVLLDVDNLDEYNKIQNENSYHLEYFNFNFDLVMSLCGKNAHIRRMEYTKALLSNYKGKDFEKVFKDVLKDVTRHSIGFMRTMASKKLFINNHSKKLEIANMIIEHRPKSKIITFSNNIKMAEAIKYGQVYSGRDSKKRSTEILNEFNDVEYGVINSSKKLITGADIKGVNCEIVLGQDSSQTRASQSAGRVLRVEGDKTSEIFNIVINDTVEVKWFENSHKNRPYIKIDVDNLLKVLNYEQFDTYKRPSTYFTYRY